MTDNITYHKNLVERCDRLRLTGQNPAVVWFTGLSGSGKSTVAAALEARLIHNGYPAYLLDGDNIRFGLNAGLGFTQADRAENIRRLTEAARLIADSGQIAIVSAISPMREMRDNARKRIADSGIDFIEVYADTPVEECARRDVKGLYKRAFAGEIADFTGVSAPYEAPLSPEITLPYSPVVSADDNARTVYEYITSRQLDCDRLLGDMETVAIEAGGRIMEIYGSDFKVDIKEDKSPLTDADRASNAVITAALQAKYPRISILTEESADDPTRHFNRLCFIIDPLDGTKEFIKRNGEFTVNIALACDHVSVAGVIYVPATGELYSAAVGKGSWRTRNGIRERIHVSDRTSDIIVMESRSHNTPQQEKLLEANAHKIASVISAGSSLKGCRIAEGAADIYYRCGPTMEWDTAAMQIICEEAGATLRQLDGYDSPMYYNRTHTRNDLGFYIINNAANKLE